MNKEENQAFIFYLSLDESLPQNFYIFDRCLRDLGFFLVPVKMDQLQTLVATSDQTQVIVLSCVSDVRELKLYNEKIRGLLKYILKSKRMTFMHLSSFSQTNDMKLFSLTKNYFFLKLPLDARILSARIARYHDQKSETKLRWPGGKRAGLGAVS
jgi:hypothetical protein